MLEMLSCFVVPVVCDISDDWLVLAPPPGVSGLLPRLVMASNETVECENRASPDVCRKNLPPSVLPVGYGCAIDDEVDDVKSVLPADSCPLNDDRKRNSENIKRQIKGTTNVTQYAEDWLLCTAY